MNAFFSKLLSIEHTFVGWFTKSALTVAKDAPAIESVIATGLKYIGPALQIGLSVTGNPGGAVIAGQVISEAQKDLLVASSLVYDFGPTPTAATVFSSVKDNLSALLTAGHITGAKSVDAVTKAVANVGALGQAVQAAADAIVPTVVTAQSVINTPIKVQ